MTDLKANIEILAQILAINAPVLALLNGSSTATTSDRPTRLIHHNPQFAGEQNAVGPHGDATPLNGHTCDTEFQIVNCSNDGGTLKPDVVFFGDKVPEERVHRCIDALREAVCFVSAALFRAFVSAVRQLNRISR